MARMHGSDCRVYFGKRDISGDLVSIDLSGTTETHDVTNFASSNFREFAPGQSSWEASFSALYQTEATPGLTTISRQLDALFGLNTADTQILSVYDGDADLAGDRGWLGGDAVLNKVTEPIAVGDMIKMTATIQGNGSLGLNGTLLAPLATVTTATNGTSVDNAASTANGMRANLHVTAVTGTGGTVKVQHSSDNSTWVDFHTFSAATAATSQTKTATGTVNRYLRSVITPVASSGLTCVVGAARY